MCKSHQNSESVAQIPFINRVKAFASRLLHTPPSPVRGCQLQQQRTDSQLAPPFAPGSANIPDKTSHHNGIGEEGWMIFVASSLYSPCCFAAYSSITCIQRRQSSCWFSFFWLSGCDVLSNGDIHVRITRGVRQNHCADVLRTHQDPADTSFYLSSLFPWSLGSVSLSSTWPSLLISFPRDSAKHCPGIFHLRSSGVLHLGKWLSFGQSLILLPGTLHCHICQLEVSDPIWLLSWATGPHPRTARTPELMI